ncbi:MAG: lytic transglycosylase domain-containing protein [Pseudomonadota bacterium]
MLWQGRAWRVAAMLGVVAAVAVLAGTVEVPRADAGEVKLRMAQTATFKRVRPPRGGGRRITIQIGRPDTRQPAVISRPVRYPWFWEELSPDLAAASDSRLRDAAEIVAGRQSLGTTRDGVAEIARRHGAAINAAAEANNVSEALLLAVISIESRGQTDAVSSAGAQGLMQLMPATARRFDVADPFDPGANIAGGARYLDWLLDTFDADPILALAGYNAGENAVRRAGGVPNYRETRDYIPLVVDAWRVAREFCEAPPRSARDRCPLPVRLAAPE